MVEDALKAEALRLLERLQTMPFEECIPLQREFDTLPTGLGVYALRHRTEGILYLGKTLNIRGRFMSGHKALYYAYLDQIPPADLRIAVIVLRFQQRSQLLDLEAVMLQVAKPRYNMVIRQSED